MFPRLTPRSNSTKKKRLSKRQNNNIYQNWNRRNQFYLNETKSSSELIAFIICKTIMTFHWTFIVFK
ncbi:unnamed protein product [Rotaria socialis]